jgi:hypothetical protein
MERLTIDLGWAAPARAVDAGTARRGILWQHERIRALLEKARDVADLALDGDATSTGAVAPVIADMRSTLEVHLTFEEKVLIPLFREDTPAGPQRADRLLDEHRHQRDMLAALDREASAFPRLPMLAAKLAFLSSWLLADMVEEERSLLTEEGSHGETADSCDDDPPSLRTASTSRTT